MRIHALSGLALVAVLLGACDDPNDGFFEPIIREDTVDLAAPLVDPEVPTALDISYATSAIRARFPELVADAQEWDVAIRREDDVLLFVPAGVFGFQNPTGGPSTAAVTLPLERGIDEIREAPGDSQLHGDTTIAIQADRTYILRSRRTSASYTGCENYAKVQPLSVDATAGTVKLRVIGNARCNDRRLVEVD